jgi:DNA end-binding protein Ku
MPPHALGSGTISFGLVSIPIRLYTAASSGNVAFNMLHAKCGSRIKQQTFCPTCNETIERSALVRGYEYGKDQYVRVADEELKALEGEASKMIDIAEFVPLAKVDPIYFEKTYTSAPTRAVRSRTVCSPTPWRSRGRSRWRRSSCAARRASC